MTSRPPDDAVNGQDRAAADRTARISILDERLVRTQPVPGEVRDQVAVTFRIAPNPPEVIFVPVESLAAWQHRQANPGKDVPAGVQQRSDEQLRAIILQRRRPAAPAPRTI